jgi:hypothetical protein
MNVYTPIFTKTTEQTPEGRAMYRVEMRVGPSLKAETPEDALAEAKAMGILAPIVG